MSGFSGPNWEFYMREKGIEHFPEHVLKRLTLANGLKHLMQEIGIENTPFLKNWYEAKFIELSGGSELEPYEKWRRLTALLGLICNRFYSRDLKIPEEWVEGYGFCKRNYFLAQVSELSDYSLLFSEWDHKFHDPERVYVDSGKKNPWLLRAELALEFAGLYFGRAREIIHALNDKLSSEETLKLHRALREHVDECAWYDRMMLLEKIRLKLPEFGREFAASADPAVKFAIAALNEICTYKGKISRDVLLILLESYWERLKDVSKGAEAKKLVELIQTEVTELIEANCEVAP